MANAKLTDIQLILLTTAAQRDDGSLLPPPERLYDQRARILRAIPPLLKRALVEEIAVNEVSRVWREDGETLIGLAITAAGRGLVAGEGVEPQPSAVPSPAIENATPSQPATKIGLVVAMLGRDTGATITELTAATGWLPHTTRAALTGLRKKGHAITRGERDGLTAYTIATVA